MALELHPPGDGKTLAVRASGKLSLEDYERLIPEVERRIGQHGTIRLLFDMHDFHGWTAGALWLDAKFGLKHFRHVERLALVGEKAWQRGLALFCKPFTAAKVRYFARDQAGEAESWVQVDPPGARERRGPATSPP